VQLAWNRTRLALGAVLLTLGASACGTGGVVEQSSDQARGKELFTEKCAACHTLAAANAQGKIGPDLDATFGAAYEQGFEESTVRQVVADQIQFAGNFGADGPTMPQDLVTGDDIDIVASYVASVAGQKSVGGAAAGGGSTSPGGSAGGTTTGATTGGEDEGQGATAGGKAVYDANGCGSCHTFQPAGSTGKVGPDLDKLAQYAQAAGKPLDEFIRESIVDPGAYTEKGFPQGVMPPFSNLSEDDLNALVEYLSSG
jgi:mono/diheme cytochrome c family protein